MAQRFTRRTRDLDTIRTATHYTYKNITGVQICLFGISMGVTCTLLHVHTKIHVHGISHSGEWPIIFFDARNLNLRAPLIYNLVCPCSLTTSCVILRGKNSCSAVLSCQLGFSRTKKFDSKRNQKKIFRIATYSCRENESSMTHVEEEYDWTHMASAFFRGHGKGRIHTSFLSQPIELSKERNFFNLKNIEASEQKSWLHQTRLL